MNIEAYNLDSLRELVRNLQDENRRLRELLRERNVPCSVESSFDKTSLILTQKHLSRTSLSQNEKS